jgi:hypothetical protein
MLVESGFHLDYAGSIYTLSPFLSLFSQEQANRWLQRELSGRPRWGMILVAVAVKP